MAQWRLSDTVGSNNEYTTRQQRERETGLRKIDYPQHWWLKRRRAPSSPIETAEGDGSTEAVLTRSATRGMALGYRERHWYGIAAAKRRAAWQRRQRQRSGEADPWSASMGEPRATPDGRCSDAGPVGSFSPFHGAFIPERPDDINEGMREGIKAGDTPLCLELLAAKADPNYRDRQGNTPLHMACLFNRTDVAKALLHAGSDLTLKNGAGELPERMATVSLKMKFATYKESGQI